jgi:ParB family chromosome partitioning protein
MKDETPANVPGERPADRLIALPIELIDRDPKQPRKYFDEKEMAELAASIAEFGVIEPIVVRGKANGRYQLVAGERRWRASQRVGLLQIPAVVRERQGKTEAMVSLVENIQRSDLDTISTAEAIAEAMESTGMTQTEVGRSIGKTQGYVAQLLGLLTLDSSVRDMIRTGEIGYVVAHVLKDLPGAEQRRIAALAKDQNLSPMAVRRLLAANSGTQTPKKSVYARDLEARLERALGCKVFLEVNKKNRGELRIKLGSLDDIDRIVEAIL